MITDTFKNKPVFVGYLTAGDGGLQKTKQAMQALVDGGVDILEVGIPFSDPVADGPIIQQAATRALQQGASLQNILPMIAEFKRFNHTPVIIFSYFNPIFQAKRQNPNFYQTLKDYGVDGCLVVDLPLEEMQSHYVDCINNQIDPIFLISPSTPIERIAKINQKGQGMFYYVCRKGTTGIKTDLPPDLKQRLTEIKHICQLPVVVGFGVSNREMAKKICDIADGFVVGSYFVKALASGENTRTLKALATSIDPRQAR